MSRSPSDFEGKGVRALFKRRHQRERPYLAVKGSDPFTALPLVVNTYAPQAPRAEVVRGRVWSHRALAAGRRGGGTGSTPPGCQG